MKVYRVMLSGEGFSLQIEGERKPGGFVRNQYVMAGSEEEAIEKAKQQAITRLAASMASDYTPSGLRFTVEEVEVGWNMLWLLRNEGFAFHPAGE